MTESGKIAERLSNSLSQAQLKRIDGLGKKFILAYWAQESGIILDGRPFSFDNHEYLIDIYLDESPYKVFKKAAQLGFSTYEMLKSVFSTKNIYPTGILYLFPTKDDVTDFSKSRFSRLIDENPKTIGTWLKNTDQANIKQIGTSFLYLRGSRTRTALKSIPVDGLVFDEFDEMRPGSGTVSGDRSTKFDPIALARERYSHSEFQHEDILSTPTLPDYGIEAEFEETDQKHWYIHCKACNTYTCLELEFPSCLKVRKNGTVYRACKKCEREINPSDGVYVAHFKDREKSGYYVSQLNSKYINPKTIYDQYMNLDSMTTTKRTEFWNSKIGMGYVEVEHRLSKQQILSLCESMAMDSMDKGNAGPCFMGVDQGKNLHVLIARKESETNTRLVHMGVYKEWEDLDTLIENFNIWRAVVDAQPEIRSARNFAQRHWGKVFMNYYNYRMKGEVRWNQKELVVEENRTEYLDESHNLIMRAKLTLPRQSAEVEEFAKHCCNIAKKLEEDDETGSKEYMYITLGPDHYRHALNYLNIAGINAPIVFPSTHDGIEGFRKDFMRDTGEQQELCNTYH